MHDFCLNIKVHLYCFFTHIERFTFSKWSKVSYKPTSVFHLFLKYVPTFGEENADHKTQRNGRDAEHEKEHKYQDRIAVVDHGTLVANFDRVEYRHEDHRDEEEQQVLEEPGHPV